VHYNKIQHQSISEGNVEKKNDVYVSRSRPGGGYWDYKILPVPHHDMNGFVQQTVEIEGVAPIDILPYSVLSTLRYYTPEDKGSRMKFNTVTMREIFKMESDELYKNYIDFHMEGYERFNTQLVRNTIFLSNIQRILRSKINDVFVKAHKIVERSHKIADYSITEYNLVDKGTYSNPNTWSNI
jgi:hypothetical protein